MKNKKRFWIVIICVIALLVTSLIVGWYLFSRQTYDKVEVLDTYVGSASNDSSYVYYAKGVLKYSRDGVALFDKNGEELWNQPCQMQSPIVEICGDTAVLGDKGGTSVAVLTRDGVKGEFQTSRPIERLTVSAQGIVGAVLKDETTPWIVCYDAKGEILVEQKTSLANTGYPIDISISRDGKTLLAAYLCTNENSVSTRVSYYNFDEGTTEHEVATETYSNMLIPTATFINQSTSMLVGDSAVIFWKGTKKPEQTMRIDIDKEIKSVAYDEEKVALVLKNKETSGYELRVYNTNGKQVTSTTFEGEYDNIKMSGQQVILYEGNKCLVINMTGVVRYNGKVDVSIQEIYPLWGIDRFMIVSADGMQKVQLTK